LVSLDFSVFALEDNYVKTNEDTTILSAIKMFARDSSFWRHARRSLSTVGGGANSGQSTPPLLFSSHSPSFSPRGMM